MTRITVTTAELEATLAVWLTTAGIKDPAMIRDLWTRTGELRDVSKQDAARHALAKYLVKRMTMSGWQVTKLPVAPERGR